MSDYIESVKIKGEGHESLVAALHLAMVEYWPKTTSIRGYSVDEQDGKPRLRLVGYDPQVPLPGPIVTAEGAAVVVEAWFAGLDREAWGRYPDTDGSAHQGWAVSRLWEGVEVQPHWVVYGK